MKKILLFASALAGLFLAGCQRENLEPEQAGQQVTFTIEAPAAMQTKAIADGLNVDELIYEVWITKTPNAKTLDGATRLYQAKTGMTYDDANKRMKANITLDLVNDQNFTVLFWAQKEGIGVYDTEWLNAVTYTDLTPNAFAANDALLDAFYSKAYVVDCQTATPTVVLRRPFAQVNLCTLNKKDAAQVPGNYNISLVSSEMRLDAVPTVFNVATSEATDYVAMDFAANTVPSGDDETITVNGQEYFYAGMNYVFAGANIVLTYDIQTKLNETVDANVNNTIQNVPLKENHRTNIVGNLLTSQTDFEIIVDADFYEPAEVVAVWDGSSVTEPTVETDATTGEAVYVVDEASDLAWFAQIVNGTLTRAATVAEYDFKLTADIDLGNHPWTPIGINDKQYYTGTFDGGNHTIKNLNIVETEAKEGKAYIGFFGYAKDATIKNLNFENVNLNIPCLDIDHSQGHIGAVAGSLEGTSTIENVTVKGDIKVEATVTANGASRVAVVAGGNSYGDVTMKNVHVIADEGSYLKANNNTGALAGQLQGKSVFENCSSNIDVTGTKFFAGGIIGIAAGDQTFTNCHTTGDITITAGRLGKAHDHYRVGGIAGGWADGAKNVCTLTDCSYTGTLSGTNADGSVAEVLDYAGYVGRGYTLNGCQGSKVVIDGVEYVQAYNTAADAGLYYVNGEYTIASAANLKVFANKVNAGEDYFEGKTVKLANDIDLNNTEWTPIGSAVKDHGFMGNFDGNGKTIKNLKMTTLPLDADNYVYAGLFGVTEGTSPTQQNIIKNLVIENVTIDTEGHIAAAAIAYPYYTTVENITVKGDINIKGGDYTSGALAYTRRCVNAKNITVAGNDGSSIEGTQTVGGVISDIQMNGGLTADYSNFKASGLTIKGMKSVGGISGIISQQTLNGAVVENVVIVCNDVRKGIVSGSIGGDSTINNITANNVTGATNYVGATYDNGKTCKLTIDGVVYEYCNGYYKADEKAFVSNADGLVAALEANEDVVFMNDIKIDPANMSNAYGKTGINVKNGQTIDGNGYTLNIKGAGGTWDSGINTTGGLIKNLTVTGSFRGIFINHTSTYSEKVVLENVTITGTVYTISCDQGLYQGIEATNCTFNGWTSFAKTAGEAKFVNCSFGVGSGYKYCRPYSKTEFVECTFCPGYTVDTTQAEVTFTDCTWEE